MEHYVGLDVSLKLTAICIEGRSLPRTNGSTRRSYM
jgi:hypothetical protein